jgi:hypothetical protein
MGSFQASGEAFDAPAAALGNDDASQWLLLTLPGVGR